MKQFTIRKTDGTWSREKAENVFGWIDSDIENWNCSGNDAMAAEQKVEYKKLDKNGTFIGMFGSNPKCFTKAQVMEIVTSHSELLKDNGYGNFFPYRNADGERFVLYVYRTGSAWYLDVGRLESDDVWNTEHEDVLFFLNEENKSDSYRTIQIKESETKVSNEDFEWISSRKWSLDKDGYVRGSEGYLSRQIIEKIIGEIPKGIVVDHKNRDILDNRRENLRIATRSENMSNAMRGTKSGFRGVKSHFKKWRADIGCDGGKIFLGLFDSPEDAAMAYDNKSLEIYGEFSITNFPQHDSSPLEASAALTLEPSDTVSLSDRQLIADLKSRGYTITRTY